MKNTILGINKAVSGVQIREYVTQNGKRYFTATILKWRGFKFSSFNIKSTPLLTNCVIPKVTEIRDRLKGKTLDEQKVIVDEYPTHFNYYNYGMETEISLIELRKLKSSLKKQRNETSRNNFR